MFVLEELNTKIRAAGICETASMKEELRKITHVQGIVLVTNPLRSGYLSVQQMYPITRQHVRTAHPAVSSKLPQNHHDVSERDQGSTQ